MFVVFRRVLFIGLTSRLSLSNLCSYIWVWINMYVCMYVCSHRMAPSPPSPHDRGICRAFSWVLIKGLPEAEILVIREVKDHVYVKRQTRICTTWPSFPFSCRLLFIISTHKLVVSSNFLPIREFLSCFYLLIFYFEKFST